MRIINQLFQDALRDLLSELIDGPGSDAAFILDSKAVGLIAVLELIPADAASHEPSPGQMSIAAHVNHLRYSLQLLNRWAAGEPNPFATADWAASWKTQVVSLDEWRQLVDQLRHEAQAWLAAAPQPREYDRLSFTAAFASVAHIAYHYGAIRQLALLHE